MKTPVTPGEILLEDYLAPMGISQNALARALGVSPRGINAIVLGRRAITPEMSLKLGKFFQQSPRFWFNLQNSCDFRRGDPPRLLAVCRLLSAPCSLLHAPCS